MTISTKLVTVSIIVSVLKVCDRPCIWTVQGPVRSTATSSEGTGFNYLSGSSPYPAPSNLCFWHALHLNLSTVLQSSL